MKFLVLCTLLLLLTGCSGTLTAPALPAQTQVADPTPTLQAPPLPTLLPTEQGAPPVVVQLPALRMQVPVTEMGWKVVTVSGNRQVEWEVPLDSAGWHPTSAKPGTSGTVIISGHHHLGSAVFAPIAQGGVQQGIEIIVKDALDRNWYYRVLEVSQPIPVSGATEAEQQQLDNYLATSDQPRLVLLTGWPEFSDTHYLAVVAELYCGCNEN